MERPCNETSYFQLPQVPKCPWAAYASDFTRICYPNHEQFAEHICHHLHCSLANHMSMAADEVDRGCEQAGTGAGSFHPDLFVLTV